MDPQGVQKPNVAIFSSTGMGHLIPFMEFAKRLSVCHGFSITFIVTRSYVSAREIDCARRLASLGLDIRLVELPQVEIQGEDKVMKPVTLKSKIMEKSVDLLESLLKDLVNSSSSPICAFITDMFSTVTLDVAANLNIPSYIFVASPASFLALMLYLPRLISELGQISFKDLHLPVRIPGLPPIPGHDFPHSLLDRSDEAYDYFLQHCLRLRKPNGILVNTFHDLESECINALLTGQILSAEEMPSIYTIGPIISSTVTSEPEKVPTDKAECLKWLDQQPSSSVLFVSFGSEASLSAPQIVELALGLEASGQRFLWVLRNPPPPNPSVNFRFVSDPDIPQLLPEGFETRTKNRGLVVASWAPQIPILSHPSTGGFLSHCGWNSVLESITCGVPIIAWPIQAEQRMNKVFLVNKITVAIEAKRGMDGIVGKEEVERAARELMEGEDGIRMRMRMRELQEKANKAIAPGGTSYKSLAAATAVWKKNALQLNDRPVFDGQ